MRHHGDVEVAGMAGRAKSQAILPVGKIALGACEEGHHMMVMEGGCWNMGVGFPVFL